MAGAARTFWDKLAARSESNLYFALVFLPAAQRDAFRDVYRFLRTADDVVDSELPDADKRAGLSAWRAELDAIFAPGASLPLSHPDAERLRLTVQRLGLPRAHFDTILDALEEDLPARRFATRAELERWCEHMSSTLGYLCVHILGARSPAATAYARDMGVALQLCNILRDVDEDARRGHLYLPLDELGAAGVAADDVLARRPSPGLAVTCARLAGRARELVASARRHLAELPAAEQIALTVPEIWADVYLALLDQLAAAGHDPLAGALRLPRRRKLRIAMARWVRAGGRRAARRILHALPLP
jgi:phytoene synthase